jgi:hypothetical protein
MNYKKISLLGLLALIVLSLGSCNSSYKKKIEGKWKVETYRYGNGDDPIKETEDIYYIFKEGQCLYHNETLWGKTEKWETNAESYTVNEKDHRLYLSGYYYKIAFKSGGRLQLTDDNPGSGLYGHMKVLKKVHN